MNNVTPTEINVLKPGYVYNPWRKWPRNLACVCGSGLKFKVCHANNLSHAILITESDRANQEFSNALKFVETLKARGINYKREQKTEVKDEQPTTSEKTNDVSRVQQGVGTP